MSWIAIGAVAVGTAVSAGGTYLSNKKSQEAAEENAAAQDPSLIKLADPTLLGDPAQINPLDVLSQLYGANWENRQQGRDQSRIINKFNFKEALKYYNKIQPNFSANQALIGQNANSMARGELPADVQDQIARSAAQRGIQGGFGFGSQGASGGALGNLNLRNLGLTSLDLSKYGTNLAMQANMQAKQLLPNLSGLQDFFLNPQQVLGINQFNTGVQNQFAMQNNATENQFALQNVTAQNQAQANQNQANYGAALQQAQMYGQMGQAIGGGISSLAGGLGTGATPAPTTAGQVPRTTADMYSYNPMTTQYAGRTLA